ncbi:MULTISPECIES: LysE family transporter [Marinobacter]|uniref:LysE family transporter n=1 Tax=Marinobacter xiaoshiensis TaxID=3073652 RepID=A0ABU2HJ53_9GAMM|nr:MULTISPECIES: LysE family transporter [unclassified Marinobacter]MBK1873076.1 LysE family transporter [Marinobacter sp. 1-3A]MBK1886311.1 LysE family transporter [Marinobacter sp. DY40_1A1]MDS1311092.1 LysE family transporter [Marinobacter sp. F60267]
MNSYWPEFFTVALVHLLAVASPGPDFAVMLRQALCQSRRNALLTAAGIGVGILVHVSYSLLGIGLIIQQSILLFTILKIAGALYLTWIAVQCLRAQEGGVYVDTKNSSQQTGLAALRLGFLTNALNPKATLFFVSLFSVIISPGTPVAVQAGYGAYMALATGLWFTLVAVFFTLPAVRKNFNRFGHWLDRLMGGVLLLLAGQLLLSTVSGAEPPSDPSSGMGQ